MGLIQGFVTRGVPALVILFGFWTGTTHAFSPEVLRSVVSVLPEWPERGAPGPTTDGRLEEPEATAVAVLPGGYLATNVHVLGRATKAKVRLSDGRILPAEIIGRDGFTDIALIRVAMDLPVLEVGPEPSLAAPVCTIGNQFGLDLSVTCGVVSAVHRSGTGFNPIEDFIQTDAVVNPGGSGGALVDADGHLIGLVSAIFSKRSDADIGVNFAASMPLVLRVITDLRDHGRVVRGKSGLLVQDLSVEDRATLVGARITRVTSAGAAAAAGLKKGDIITDVDGRRITRASDVSAAVYLHRAGQGFEVSVIRGTENRTVTLNLKP
jgi:S1-C subfamily serine protease